MPDSIKKLFPKEFYNNRKMEEVAEISLDNLNKILNYIVNLEEQILVLRSRIDDLEDKILWQEEHV